MDKKVFSLDIDKFSIVDAEEESQNQLAIVEIYVCHDGNNLHNCPISNKALRKAKDTLKNKFLVAGFDGKDFEGHEIDEQIIGFFPESSQMRFEKIGDRTYLVAQAIMSKIYAKWAYDVFVKGNNERAVSMEITVLAGKVDAMDNLLTIEEFVFNGVTVLGINHVPACEGSSASIIKFDAENALRVYNKHCNQATDLKKKYVDNMVKFSGKEESKQMNEEEVKVEKKVEEEAEDKEEKVECEIPEEKDDETLYSESEKKDESEEKEEDEKGDKKEVDQEVECETAETVEEDNLPAENCEAEPTEETESPEGEEVETLESVIAERDSLKEKYELLKAKLDKYEAEEKIMKVESILSEVENAFSSEEMSELRTESEKFSLEELNIFANSVKAKAFDAVKGKNKNETKSFTKVAINDVLDKPKSKYTW